MHAQLLLQQLYLQSFLCGEVGRIFDAVFQCTLEMINRDMQEFPEHRINFFLLLKVVVVVFSFNSIDMNIINDMIGYRQSLNIVLKLSLSCHPCNSNYLWTVLYGRLNTVCEMWQKLVNTLLITAFLSI
jgi:hypothetical protein